MSIANHQAAPAGEQVWEAAVSQLERAADTLGLDPGLTAMLSRPRRSIEVAVLNRQPPGVIGLWMQTITAAKPIRLVASLPWKAVH